MTQVNQSVELDNNLLSSNYQSVNSSLSQKSSSSSIKSSIISSGMEKKRDIEMETAAHLLTKQEKSLCLQLDLKPTQYLAQKTLLLQEYLSGNRKTNIIPQSEPENKILHYLVTNGWVAAN